LGLRTGLSRQISYFRELGESKKMNSILFFSVVAAILSGCAIFLLLFFSADILASAVFTNPELASIIRLFSIGIPFLVLIHLFSSIFRGFKRVIERIIFLDISINLFFLFFLVLKGVINYSFYWAVVLYLISIVLTCLFFGFYLSKKQKDFAVFSPKVERSNSLLVGKELLLFSLPFMIIELLNLLREGVDIILIGILAEARIIGYYNSSLKIARLVFFPMNALIFIFMPVFTALLVNNGKKTDNNNREIKRNYEILTKWISLLSLPVALMFFFYPGVLLNFIFGSEYTIAAWSLRILAIGFLLNNLMGPNGSALTAMGETKTLMIVTLCGIMLNGFLNILLIPFWGINGVALSTAAMLVLIGGLRALKLFCVEKVHSLTLQILKPLICSIILTSFFTILANSVIPSTQSILFCLISFIIFYFITFISVIITGSLEKEDINMVVIIENLLGIKLSKIKNFLEKFIDLS
ncbi:MAG: flippase, partial [Promethearchaeia archaeon]